MKWLCSDFFLSFLFFIQKINFLLPFVIAYFHYSVHAGQKSGDIRVIKVDSHQAATVTLGNAFKLVHKQKIPDVREKSLRFSARRQLQSLPKNNRSNHD